MNRSQAALFLTALTVTFPIASGQAWASGHARHRHPQRGRAGGRRASVTARGDTGDMFSAVGAAANVGYASRLRALFARGASANYMYENGMQPLLLAADGAHVEAVRLLIAHGAYLDGQDNGGSSALDRAEGHERYSADPVLRAKYAQVVALLTAARAKARNDGAPASGRRGPGR